MTTLICNKPGCTLAQTGTCILDNDPEMCPDRISLSDAVIGSQTITAEDIVTSVSVKDVVRLKSSYALSTEQVKAIMTEQYCKVVGILGIPGAGKTACLASLYLLLSHNKLAGYEFRNSKTLMAFEEISRGAKWGGSVQPEELVLHTSIAEGRTAGFLHLRLSSKENKIVDLLLPDIPGEWTSAFVDNNRTDRLSFLKSAEALWVFVNGEELYNINTRNVTTHRLGLLFERISIYYGTSSPKVVLVVSHKDQISIELQHYSKIEQLAERFGVSIKIIKIASFSSNQEVVAGDGISELIKDLVEVNDTNTASFISSGVRRSQDFSRQMLNFGQNSNYDVR